MEGDGKLKTLIDSWDAIPPTIEATQWISPAPNRQTSQTRSSGTVTPPPPMSFSIPTASAFNLDTSSSNSLHIQITERIVSTSDLDSSPSMTISIWSMSKGHFTQELRGRDHWNLKPLWWKMPNPPLLYTLHHSWYLVSHTRLAKQSKQDAILMPSVISMDAKLIWHPTWHVMDNIHGLPDFASSPPQKDGSNTEPGDHVTSKSRNLWLNMTCCVEPTWIEWY